MNFLKFLLIITAFLSLYSCHDKEENDPCRKEEWKGDMTMNINGIEYECYTSTIETSTLLIGGIYIDKPSCVMTQVLQFVVPFKEGTFLGGDHVDSTLQIAKTTFSYVDYDILLANYRIPAGKENGIIELENYNPETKEITGSFSIVLYINHNWGLQNPPDSLSVYGSFTAYL